MVGQAAEAGCVLNWFPTCIFFVGLVIFYLFFSPNFWPHYVQGEAIQKLR